MTDASSAPAQPPKRKPAPRKPVGQVSSTQVMFAVIIALGLILAFGFSSRITAGQQLQTAYEGVLDEIEQLRQEQAALIEQRDYVRSDAYVESWARSDGKMVRPGMRLVIPVPSGVDAAESAAILSAEGIDVQTTPPEPDAWLLWWQLFFDGEPPEF